MAIASPTSQHPHPAFDAVIWDYDGTLVATRAADEYAVDVLLERDPSAAEGTALFWATEGRPIEERIERSWPGRIAEILPLFENDVRPVPFDGVLDVLTGIAAMGLPQAVVSSRRRHTLEAGLDMTELSTYFSVVIGLDDVTEPKPAPEGLLKALRHLGIPPTRAVYIGDSPVDNEAGRRAGTTVWRAAWAKGVAPNQPPALVLARPRDIMSLIDHQRGLSLP